MVDIYQANDLIDNTLSDKQKQVLWDARAGFPKAGSDKKLMQSVLDLGLITVVNFENVKAWNAIEGYVLTGDGEKVLQTIEARPGVVISHVPEQVDGQLVDTVQVEVKDATPVAPGEEAPVTEDTSALDAQKDVASTEEQPNPDNKADRKRLGKSA